MYPERFVKLGASVRRLSKIATVSVEVSLVDFKRFFAGFTYFCYPFFLFQLVLPHNFPDILPALPCDRDLKTPRSWAK